MYGKIVSKEEADKLFGPVIESKEISKDDLLALIQATEKNVLFNIINSELIIMGDGRKVLLPEGKAVAAEVVFHLASKELVIQIINTSIQNVIYCEQRKDVFTVSNGDNILEWTANCPPICW